MAANWSSLPLDLLAFIAFKLISLEDFIYFSAVCRSWNCASSSIKHQWRPTTPLPWLLLAENTKDNPNCARKIFNLNNNKCYNSNLPETFGARCCGSPYGWVVVAKSDHTIQLINPITKAHISFPSLETILNLRETGAESFDDYNDWCLTFFLTKLIVLNVSHAGRNEFVIMIIYQFNKYLAFARQGDQSWTDILIKETSIKIFDVVAMDDHVYVVYDYGAIAYWNVREFYNVEVVKPMDYSPPQHEIFKVPPYPYIRNVYLIQSGSDLLMVLRYKENVMNGLNRADPDYDYDYDSIYRTVDFKVYKLNPKEKKWEYIEDLGDLTLFVGDSSSMSTLLAHDKNLQPNCIYFTDDECSDWSMVTELGGHDMGIYDINSAQVLRRFYEGTDTRSAFCPPTFFFPQL
ncbi:F-box protein SKIP23-like [Silene latifolia]|uniref:F-box protein SKIP23-like n=1 Tax=Silene latifolia TaxID=37657 RepID=UPI003D76EC9B